jgi:iron complex transport system substrate-binding protein
VHRRLIAALLPLLAVAALAACGDDDSPSAGASGGSDTTAASAGGGDAAAVPQRIVSISPVATEILWAVGAADQVIAVDDNSNYPPDVPTTDISSFEPNVEAIAAYEPDLVVTSMGTPEVVDGLEAIGIPVLVQEAPDDLDGAYEQIVEIGEVTGHEQEAADLVEEMQRDLEEIAAQVDAEGMTYYYELDPTLYSLTSDTFIGIVLGHLGLVSIADAAPGGGTYPQLSAEFVLDQDPDLILLADTKCCGQDVGSLAARPGWSELRAVQAGDVVELDDDIASRWGPRLVDLLRQVAEAAAGVERRS